jgi:hypothetical protein
VLSTRWVLDFSDQFGVRRWVTTQWSADTDKPKADKLLARLSVQVDEGVFEARNEQRTFPQLVEAYISQLDVRELTKLEYQQIITARLQPFFGGMKLRASRRMPSKSCADGPNPKESPCGQSIRI